MKKKGFTLAELLGVIVILGVLAILVIPVIDRTLKQNKQGLYETQIDNIKKGAQSWASENPFMLPEKVGEQLSITLSQLKQAGRVETDIKDPRTKKLFPNDMLIEVTKGVNGLVFDVIEESGTDGMRIPFDPLAPFIALKGKATETLELDINSDLIYQDKGVIARSADGAVLSNITTEIKKQNQLVSEISYRELETYTITYTVTDGTFRSSVARMVQVRDTTPPTIHLLDDTTIRSTDSLDVNQGVTVTDNSGPVTYTVSSNLANIPGSYQIAYTAKDSAGNTTVKKRIITVIP